MMTRFDVPLGAVINIPWASYNSSGASVTATNFDSTDIEIFKNGNLEERGDESGTGITINFDAITGLHLVKIDTSEDDSPAGFWTVGAEYNIALRSGTIDSQTVSAWIAWFRVVAAESSVGVPKVDLSHIAGSSVSTSTAQIGVNVVNFGGSAGTFSSGRPEVNTTHAAGTAWGSGAITAGAIAADAIGASELAADAATEIATAVWASGTRSLTILDEDSTTIDIDNSVWGGGTRSLTVLDEDSTTLDLDATIRAAVGLASANLDTQIGDLPTNAELTTALGTADDAVLAAIAALNNTSADDVWDEQVDGSVTARQLMRLYASALGGKASGLATTTAVYRDLADSKDRITATVDADGNRTAVTRDLT